MRITTLTGNLLAEWTWQTGPLEAGATHRAHSSSFQVGGKGINVARILDRLGVESHAIAFAEGPIGEYCRQWLRTHGLSHCFYPLQAEVRTGLVVRDGPQRETTFLGLDQPVPAPSWEMAINHLREDPPGWLAICGSIPGWKENWDVSIESLLSDGNTRIAVDTYGPPLETLVRLPLSLVKINRSELGRLFDWSDQTDWHSIREILTRQSPVQNWIITDGAKPVHAVLSRHGNWKVTPAAMREVSPTGSGDTFLAALLSRWDEGPSVSLPFATACASANAASPHIGDFQIPPASVFYPTVSREG